MNQPYPPSPPPSGGYQPTGEPQSGAPGYPPPPPGGGQSAIAITTKFFVLAWVFFLIKPKVFLNGQEIQAQWGRLVLPVPPGQHHLHVHVPYFLPPKVGPADLTVPVQPGETVEVEYRAPMWSFSKGSLGPPPQKYNGVGITLGLLGGIFALFCACCCVGSLLSASGS